MKTQYSDREIAAFIRKIYPAALHIEKLGEGLVSQTYSFESAGFSLVFQIKKDPESYKKESYVYNEYAKKINTRKIVKIDRIDDELFYCISEKIDAEPLFDLTPEELKSNIPSILETLESLKKINVKKTKGYGYFDSDGNAPHETWQDFVNAVFNQELYDWDIENNGSAEVINMCLNEIKRHGRVLETGILDSKKNLVHGDFGSHNVLSGKSGIYLIDWELGLYGDPLYEISNITFWNEKRLEPLIKEIQKIYLGDEKSKLKNYVYMLRTGLEEIYRSQNNREAGYDIKWITGRIEDIYNQKISHVR